ncbi:MAG: hypothetical protein AAFR90_09315 [Pseudomonadota bacterium]
MSKNKNTSDKDSMGSGKPDAAGSAPKKPAPIIDLKATEVKDPDTAKPSENKPEASQYEGSAADKPTGKETGKAELTKSAVPATDSTAGKTNNTGTANEKAANKTVNDGSKPDEAGAKDTKEKEGNDKAPSKVTGQGHTANTPEKRRSGGGIGWVFTHVIASVIGGALVLFAARPIEQEFGLKVLPQPEMPAEVEARLAALEKRPVVDLPAITDDLDSQAQDIRTQRASLNTLREQVRELAERSQQEAEKPAQTAELAEQLGVFDKRIVKLEGILDNLASATGTDGRPTSLAGLTSLSGKLIELETSLLAKIDELRKGLAQQVETRFSEVGEVASSAQAATERSTRELAEASNAIAQLEQRAEIIRLAQTRINDTVRAMHEETSRLRVDLDSLKGDVNQKFETVALPQDVEGAIVPLSEQLAALQEQLKDIVASEQDRKANARRNVMAFALRNLRRALNNGGPYSEELELAKPALDPSTLSILENNADNGVPTADKLRQKFSDLAYTIIQSSHEPADSNWGHIINWAKSQTRVRHANPDEGSVEAEIVGIEQELKENELHKALNKAKELRLRLSPLSATELAYAGKQFSARERAARKLDEWMSKAEERVVVDRAIVKVENELNNSLAAVAEKG